MHSPIAGEASAPGATAPSPLILDMLEWLAASPRLYAEVMDAWRTSCPRLTVWEDAIDLGYVVRRGDQVALSPAGAGFLRRSRP